MSPKNSPIATRDEPIFELTDFTVDFAGEFGKVTLADSISLSLQRGETLCVVGESGSGKSVTFLSSVRLMEFTAPVSLSGSIRFAGEELAELSKREMTKFRGRKIGIIFQEAMEALNPTQTVATQLLEAFTTSQSDDRNAEGIKRRTADILSAGKDKALGLLTEVGMVDPSDVMGKYPHQLSGGMQQRVVIAMALMADPEVLIADEPTTALDVTIQAEILMLLKRLQRERNLSIVLITHDMGVASEIADRIAVLYAGQVIEVGPVAQMLTRPQHHYTKALLECVPRPGERLRGRMRTIAGTVPTPGEAPPGDRFAPRNPLASERSLTEAPPVIVSTDGSHSVRSWEPVEVWTPEMVDLLTGWKEGPSNLSRPEVSDQPVISLRGVNKTYAKNSHTGMKNRVRSAKANTRPGARKGTHAVRDVDLTVFQGEIFGIVGETGSGKSTLGKLIMDLEHADPGSSISVANFSLEKKRTFRQERELRSQVQMVFQNPQDSLDPRRTIGQAIAEPLRALTDLTSEQIRNRVREMLDVVGLPAASVNKYASELSGGQRQRVAIARAIAPKPKIIVADEPTSALDVSVQGQIINLMLDLQSEFGLSYVFITHNLSLITSIADRIGVMYRGELVEVVSASELQFGAHHPYTQRLLAANPNPFAQSG